MKRVWVSLLAFLLLTTLSGSSALAQQGSGNASNPSRPIRVNQTDGYGDGSLVVFTYGMNFSCIHEPFDDLDHNNKVAATDPAEFQTPRCVVGTQPTLDPTGKPIDETEKLYILVPFFDADKDGEAASGDLATALRSLFGFVPDAFDPTPGVPVQCPEPGQPLSAQKGEFGTCTMHSVKVDLGPALNSLGLVPKDTPVVVPTPNHSHIIEGKNFGSIWWHLIIVLVNDQSVWPNVAGTKGLTSVKALREAQTNGQALPDIPTNFFLFFDSREFHHAPK